MTKALFFDIDGTLVSFETVSYTHLGRQVRARTASHISVAGSIYPTLGGSSGAHLSAVSALRDPGTKVLVGFAGVYDYNMFGGDDKPYFAPKMCIRDRFSSCRSAAPAVLFRIWSRTPTKTGSVWRYTF